MKHAARGNRVRSIIGLALLSSRSWPRPRSLPQPPPPTLDQHVQEVNERSRQLSSATPGSLYFPTGRLADAVRDVRASQVYDLVTIVVLDNSSAVSTGVTNTARKSSVAAAVTSLAGPKSPTGALANLANACNNTQLQGQGTTSRGTTISTNVTAEVTAVLPNGNLVVQRAEGYLRERRKTSDHDSGHRAPGGPQPRE